MMPEQDGPVAGGTTIRAGYQVAGRCFDPTDRCPVQSARESERRHARGRAGHKCKEKFGASPVSHFVEPLRPDDAVRSWVRRRLGETAP
jgi:hypothetical protein